MSSARLLVVYCVAASVMIVAAYFSASVERGTQTHTRCAWVAWISFAVMLLSIGVRVVSR